MPSVSCDVRCFLFFCRHQARCRFLTTYLVFGNDVKAIPTQSGRRLRCFATKVHEELHTLAQAASAMTTGTL